MTQQVCSVGRSCHVCQYFAFSCLHSYPLDHNSRNKNKHGKICLTFLCPKGFWQLLYVPGQPVGDRLGVRGYQASLWLPCLCEKLIGIIEAIPQASGLSLTLHQSNLPSTGAHTSARLDVGACHLPSEITWHSWFCSQKEWIEEQTRGRILSWFLAGSAEELSLFLPAYWAPTHT